MACRVRHNKQWGMNFSGQFLTERHKGNDSYNILERSLDQYTVTEWVHGSLDIAHCPDVGPVDE